MTLRIEILAIALAITAATGCISAYQRSLDRGIALANAGNWDAAAAAYENATRIDPDEPKAKARLLDARNHQIAQRTAAVADLLRRGEVAPALDAADDAVRIDPSSQPARAAQNAAQTAAQKRGGDLLAAGDARGALNLALRLRRSDPSSAEAAALEAHAREKLAADAYARADAYAAQKQRANALLAFVETERVRPGYRDAAARAAAARGEIERELEFHVVIEQSTLGDPRDLAAAVDRELPDKLRSPERPLLFIDGRKAPDGAQGLRVAVRLEGYAAWTSSKSNVRTCSYVCGVDHVPNPAFAAATRAADDAAQRVRDADAEVARAHAELDRRTRAVATAEAAENPADSAVRRAKSDRDACSSGGPKPGKSCDREEQALKHAEAERDRALADIEAARGGARVAQDRLGRAESDQRDRKNEARDALQRLGGTPELNDVTRRCDDAFPVATHTAQASVGLVLRAGALSESTAHEIPSVPYNVAASDETFAPRPGRCPETASGDPLTLPPEEQLRQSLAARVVEGVRGSVHGSYDVFRKEFLDEEIHERAAGRGPQASEAHVRWLLLGPGADAAREIGLP